MRKMEQYVAFSGGKDSTALALLMKDAIPVFTDTGAEFPEMYAHIDKFEQVTGREVLRLKNPSGSLLEYMDRMRFMPGHGARYCTRLFKIKPMNEYLEKNLPCTLNIALRADEDRVGNLTDIKGLEIAYQLQDMGIDLMGVLKICADADLLPRYPVYMARGGCVNCFYKRKTEIWAMDSFVPEILDKLEEIEESVQDERGKFAFMFPNAGRSIKDIRRQMTMFDPEDVYRDASETEDYGVNCGLFCNR